MGIAKKLVKTCVKVGSSAVKTAKWAAKHAEEIKTVAEAGTDIYGQVSDAKEKQKATQNEKDYGKLENELWTVNEKCIDVQFKIMELTSTIDDLQLQLAECKNHLLAYQKTTQRNFLWASILSGVGVIVAVILSIVL